MKRNDYLRGLRDGVPIGLGYLAVSFGLGIACRGAGLSAAEGLLLSLLNNASAGEYGGLTVIAADAGFGLMAAMMLVINARYLLMSCVLSQHLDPATPTVQRLAVGFAVTDELFALAVAQPGYVRVGYYLGAMSAAVPCWSAGTVLGVLAGSLMPQWAVSGLSVMLFGMFLAIIVPEAKRERVVLGCVAVSFAASWAAAKWLPALAEGTRILLLTLVIAAGAAALFPRKEEA